MDRRQSTGGAPAGSGRGEPPEGGGDSATRQETFFLRGWHVTTGPPGTPLLGELEGEEHLVNYALPRQSGAERIAEKFETLGERMVRQFKEFEANAIQIGEERGLKRSEERGFQKALSSVRVWLVKRGEEKFGPEAAEQAGTLAGTVTGVERLLALASLLDQCGTADDFLRQAAATE